MCHKMTEALGYMMIYEIIEKTPDLREKAFRIKDGPKYLEAIAAQCEESFEIAIANKDVFGVNPDPVWKISKSNFEKFIRFKKEFIGRMISKKGQLGTNFNMQVLKIVFN